MVKTLKTELVYFRTLVINGPWLRRKEHNAIKVKLVIKEPA